MRYAGNKYMYMNRLRHDDFLDLFKSFGQKIIEVERRCCISGNWDRNPLF
jgi:hypothetical protein